MRSSQELSLTNFSDVDLDSTGSTHLVHGTTEEESSQHLSHPPLFDCNVDSTRYALLPYNPRPVCEIHFDDTTRNEEAFESDITSSQKLTEMPVSEENLESTSGAGGR